MIQNLSNLARTYLSYGKIWIWDSMNGQIRSKSNEETFLLVQSHLYLPMTKMIEKEAIDEEEFIIEDSQMINSQKNLDLLNSVGYLPK